MNIFRELPEQTFDLPHSRVDGFVSELKDEFSISLPAADLCAEELHWSFEHYGGFHEPPTEPDRPWFPQHNGSHAAGVVGTIAYLARYRGGSQRQVDAAVLAAVMHDKYKSIPKHPDDEPSSAAYARQRLQATKYLHRQSFVVPRMILGTPAKANERGIQQAAAHSTFYLTRLLADCDLVGLVAPNATDINLRLAIEEGRDPKDPNSTLEYLATTAIIQRKHRFLTWTASQVLGPFLAERADQVEREAAEKVRDYYAGQAA